MKYRVFVDDNFHYQDESERYPLGEFDTLEEAVRACKKIVDDFLVSTYQPGMTVAELLTQYAFHGEDPWVMTGDGTVPFSARDYASQRVRELCGEP
jgi:hypothetical protein